MAKSKLSIRDRFNSKWCPEPFSGCWIWTGNCNHKGYGNLYVDAIDRRAHRVSWELHRGPIPRDMCVLHKCDVRSCVNPDHLFLGTIADNNHDCDRKGRRQRNQVKGERVGTAVLTEALVREIRASSESSRVIAKRLGVSKQPILLIRRRERWAHVV